MRQVKFHLNVKPFQAMAGQTEGAAAPVPKPCFFGTICGGATSNPYGPPYERPDYHFDRNGNIKPEWRSLEFGYPPWTKKKWK